MHPNDMYNSVQRSIVHHNSVCSMFALITKGYEALFATGALLRTSPAQLAGEKSQSFALL